MIIRKKKKVKNERKNQYKNQLKNAISRLCEEEEIWNRNHPLGFSASPTNKKDGKRNLLAWDCIIPGKNRTIWAGGLYKLRMIFNTEYPTIPPKCKFKPPLFHPNVHPSGTVYLPLLDVKEDWHPGIRFKEILLDIQKLLNKPILQNPVQFKAFETYLQNYFQYKILVKEQAKAMAGPAEIKNKIIPKKNLQNSES